jgi:inward rectifier potassium channel
MTTSPASPAETAAASRADDPGIASTFERPLERLMSKDGTFRVHRDERATGLSEGFVALATMPAPRLIATVVATYLTLNVVFGSCYMLIGVEAIGNADLSSLGTRWLSAIGMSVQTLTTVGYGSLYPTTAATWLLAAVEGVFGILGFSLVAAVIFARFARPTARLAYSSHALIAPFKDGSELLLIVKGLDEGYMQPVITRHSFRHDELVWGGRFIRAYGVESGEARLYLSKLSSYTPVDAPERLMPA